MHCFQYVKGLLTFIIEAWESHDMMDKVLLCGFELNVFEFRLCLYVYFRINSFEKTMKPLILPTIIGYII